MTDDSTGLDRPVRASSWADAQAREALQLIVEGVRDIAGFDLVGVSVLREDGYLQVITIVGPDDAVATLQDSLAPVEPLLQQLEKADDWGPLKFIPHDRLELDVDRWGWFSDAPRVEVEGVWHPEDMLMAPIEDASGRLVGILGMELPRDGLLPDHDKQRLLEAYARQAGRAVLTTLEREKLAERVRLAEAAAGIVRRASATMTPTEILTACGPAVLESFRADALWILRLDEHGEADGPLLLHDGSTTELEPALVQVAARLAHDAWERQLVQVLAPERPLPGVLDAEERAQADRVLTAAGVESVMLVPLGSGSDLFGVMGLTRLLHGAEWSDVELGVALDIGHDLGRAVLNARALAREHQAVEELRAVDAYKNQLLATVSHELKNPLTAILGYVELLETEPLSPQGSSWLAAIQRGGGRLQRVVDDLLALHRMVEGEPESLQPVALPPLVAEAVDLQSAAATRRGVRLEVDVARDLPPVRGVAGELDQVVANLVGNAVKYSPDGGDVLVRLARVDDEVELTVTDHGLGISAADQAQLFSEFFRSSNPAAVALPGTGLGLAIVRRIVERHHGRIEVESELGEGSTFRVLLPV
ncbi:MAG: sensor histidine kinase [Nocardioides sp.]